jgi:arginase family enzyme
VFVGGDNAITRPLVTGLWGDDLAATGVLTFDAHHDVRTLDRGPSNGSPIRGLVEDGLPPAHIVQVGIHTFANSAAYRRWCEERGILVISMRRVQKDGIDSVVNGALGRLAGRCARIFVDFDIDVLDRAFAPACPGSRPGGMAPRDLLRAAELCGAHPGVAACDLVEVDPERDRDDLTLMNTAAVLLSFASGLVLRRDMARG